MTSSAQHVARSPFEKNELEQACDLVIAASLSTGHADTLLELVAELIDQTKPCPKCAARRIYNTDLKRRLRSQHG